MKIEQSPEQRSAMRPLLVVTLALWLGFVLSSIAFAFAINRSSHFVPGFIFFLLADAFLLYRAIQMTRRYRKGIPLHQQNPP